MYFFFVLGRGEVVNCSKVYRPGSYLNKRGGMHLVRLHHSFIHLVKPLATGRTD